MAYKMNWKTLLLLAFCATAITSCKLFSKKKAHSDATGWNYNDKDQGGYQVAREKEQRCCFRFTSIGDRSARTFELRLARP